MSKLFRAEALAATRQRGSGDVLRVRPVSAHVVAISFAAIAAFAAIFVAVPWVPNITRTPAVVTLCPPTGLAPTEALVQVLVADAAAHIKPGQAAALYLHEEGAVKRTIAGHIVVAGDAQCVLRGVPAGSAALRWRSDALLSLAGPLPPVVVLETQTGFRTLTQFLLRTPQK